MARRTNPNNLKRWINHSAAPALLSFAFTAIATIIATVFTNILTTSDFSEWAVSFLVVFAAIVFVLVLAGFIFLVLIREKRQREALAKAVRNSEASLLDRINVSTKAIIAAGTDDK